MSLFHPKCMDARSVVPDASTCVSAPSDSLTVCVEDTDVDVVSPTPVDFVVSDHEHVLPGVHSLGNQADEHLSLPIANEFFRLQKEDIVSAEFTDSITVSIPKATVADISLVSSHKSIHSVKENHDTSNDTLQDVGVTKSRNTLDDILVASFKPIVDSLNTIRDDLKELKQSLFRLREENSVYRKVVQDRNDHLRKQLTDLSSLTAEHANWYQSVADKLDSMHTILLRIGGINQHQNEYLENHFVQMRKEFSDGMHVIAAQLAKLKERLMTFEGDAKKI